MIFVFAYIQYFFYHSDAHLKAKSVLPFTPMTVVFDRMGYSVVLPPHMGGGTRVLLTDISGYALPGRMLALMGASGAGMS